MIAAGKTTNDFWWVNLVPLEIYGESMAPSNLIEGQGGKAARIDKNRQESLSECQQACGWNQQR